jgi:hypothetical protein
MKVILNQVQAAMMSQKVIRSQVQVQMLARAIPSRVPGEENGATANQPR